MNKLILGLLLSNLVENKLVDKKTDSKKNIAQSKDVKIQLGPDEYSPIKYERPLKKGGSYDIFPYWINSIK